MPKGDKYIEMTNYLKQCGDKEVVLSFEQIAAIVGGLPQSAYDYTASWYDGHGGSLSKSWVNAGYSAHADMNSLSVTFALKEHSTSRKIYSVKSQHHTDTISLDIKVAQTAIQTYHATTTDGAHTRYLSWVHCYQAFQKNWIDNKQTENLCLHLAVYLASWGMLRNSFLLQFDYLVHKPVVSALCASRFSKLFEHPEKSQISLVAEATEVIKTGYFQQNVSDTLVTKILLGVFGCTPAFDRYFKDAVRKYHICIGQFNRHSLESLWQYYDDNRDAFDRLRQVLVIGGTQYPPMKLLDMCCWQLGYEADSEEAE